MSSEIIKQVHETRDAAFETAYTPNNIRRVGAY